MIILHFFSKMNRLLCKNQSKINIILNWVVNNDFLLLKWGYIDDNNYIC